MNLNRRHFLSSLLGALILPSSFFTQQSLAASKGSAIFAHGGGNLSNSLLRKMVSMAGGSQARVVVVALGAHNPSKQGNSDVRMFKSNGARNVTSLSLENHKLALETIRSANLIWFSGGYQKKLVLTINSVAGLANAIRKQYRNGAVVAGSSAGAAIMSKTMISGGKNGTVYLRAGLGLWPQVIIDQHVNARRREWRLQKAIMKNPKLVGVGIDENTSVLFQNGIFTVLGSKKVRVVRWKNGGLTEEVLRRGKQYSIAKGLIK